MNHPPMDGDLKSPPPVPQGTRIRLVSMQNDPCPIEPGATGTVRGGSGAQLQVDWDNGRSLMLVPEDKWEVTD